MSQDPVVRKIMDAVKKPVTFKYPGNERPKKGILIDRVVMRSNPASADVPYWDVVDLIEFREEAHPKWIRIGYYRRPKKRLVWASQTTITESVAGWKRLLVKSAKQQKWLRDLLEDVMAELKRGTA